MKFFYNGKGFPCNWKTQMKSDNMWYSMEPVKLTVTIPQSLYDIILLDIKLRNQASVANDLQMTAPKFSAIVQILSAMDEVQYHVTDINA